MAGPLEQGQLRNTQGPVQSENAEPLFRNCSELQDSDRALNTCGLRGTWPEAHEAGLAWLWPQKPSDVSRAQVGTKGVDAMRGEAPWDLGQLRKTRCLAHIFRLYKVS